MINNYTRPPEGKPELKLSVFYDTDESNVLFEENFEPLIRGWRETLYFYTAGWTYERPIYISDIFDLSKLSFDTKKEIKGQFELWDDETEDELDEFLIRLEIDTLSIDYLTSLLDENPSDYDWCSTSGYCQGDYARVVYKKSEGSEAYNFDNYFWDSPVYARLEIDGEEWFLDEYLKDRYTYDKDLILEGFEKEYNGAEKEYVLGWLKENLTDHPFVY